MFIKIDNQIDKAYIRTFRSKFLIFSYICVRFFLHSHVFSYILRQKFLHSYPRACETAVWWVRMYVMCITTICAKRLQIYHTYCALREHERVCVIVCVCVCASARERERERLCTHTTLCSFRPSAREETTDIYHTVRFERMSGCA